MILVWVKGYMNQGKESNKMMAISSREESRLIIYEDHIIYLLTEIRGSSYQMLMPVPHLGTGKTWPHGTEGPIPGLVCLVRQLKSQITEKENDMYCVLLTRKNHDLSNNR